MAKKPTPLAGEATTTNYGWVKPTVGSSVDLWGGYINADLDSIDGVVHAIDTRPVGVTVSDTPPANPLVGQEWFDGVSGQLYVWYNDGNSSQWVIAVNAAASLLPASTTVLGGVKVDGTTIQAAPDGTISTTVVPMGDNRIINGDMRIDQRGLSAGGSSVTGYTVDRWKYGASQANKLTCASTSYFGSGGPSGFPFFLGFVSSSAYTLLTADYFIITQLVEADTVGDFAWGTAGAQPITLSFLAKSGTTGTFSGSIANGAVTRSYPFTYSLPVANTWTKIAITIPGDTAGTWVMSGNAAGLLLQFDLGAGATYRAPAGAWANGNYVGATGAVSTVSTNGAYFFVTGVKLEIGSVATPFNRQSLAKSMADCQRYYQTGNSGINTGAINGQPSGALMSFPVSMRATPTIVYGTASSGGTTGTPSVNGNKLSSIWTNMTASATGYSWFLAPWTADAEL